MNENVHLGVETIRLGIGPQRESISAVAVDNHPHRVAGGRGDLAGQSVVDRKVFTGFKPAGIHRRTERIKTARGRAGRQRTDRHQLCHAGIGNDRAGHRAADRQILIASLEADGRSVVFSFISGGGHRDLAGEVAANVQVFFPIETGRLMSADHRYRAGEVAIDVDVFLIRPHAARIIRRCRGDLAAEIVHPDVLVGIDAVDFIVGFDRDRTGEIIHRDIVPIRIHAGGIDIASHRDLAREVAIDVQHIPGIEAIGIALIAGGGNRHRGGKIAIDENGTASQQAIGPAVVAVVGHRDLAAEVATNGDVVTGTHAVGIAIPIDCQGAGEIAVYPNAPTRRLKSIGNEIIARQIGVVDDNAAGEIIDLDIIAGINTDTIAIGGHGD